MRRKTTIAAGALILLSMGLGATVLAAGKGMQDVPPIVADIMGQTQLRHIKLGYAGKVANWGLAAYETRQIRRSFDEAARAGGKIDDRSISKWFEEESRPPLAEIDKAIAEKRIDKFNTAFEDLTAACNKCHQAAGIGFVKMQVPTASPFSNQSFPP